MNLYKKACRKALADIYWDLAICNKMMQNHPDWDWLKAKKAELESKERELSRSLHEQSTEIEKKFSQQ